MTTEYANVTINQTVLGGNLFCGGEWPENLDVRASAERYAELLRQRYADEFPGAEITVTVQHGVEGVGSGAKISAGDWETENGIDAMIDDISTALYTRCDEWMVMAA